LKLLDSGFLRNDEKGHFLTFYEFVIFGISVRNEHKVKRILSGDNRNLTLPRNTGSLIGQDSLYKL